jgi:hypothetical protein
MAVQSEHADTCSSKRHRFPEIRLESKMIATRNLHHAGRCRKELLQINVYLFSQSRE